MISFDKKIVFKSTESRKPDIASYFIHIHVLLPPDSYFLNCPVPRHEHFALSTCRLTDLLTELQIKTLRRQISILDYFSPTK